MHLKHLLIAGVAAAGFAMPMSAGSALAAENDTYMCNDQVCYDDQAAETRSLNEQALDQAQQENNEGYNGMGGASYDSQDTAYRDRDTYGDRDNMYGDDDNDDAADTNSYDDDRDDND